MESLSTRLRNDLILAYASRARSPRAPPRAASRSKTDYDTYFQHQDTHSKDRSARRQRYQKQSALAADHKSDHGHVDSSDDSESDDSLLSAEDHMPMPYGDYPGAATPGKYTPSSYFSTRGASNPFAPTINPNECGYSKRWVDDVPRTQSSYFSGGGSTRGLRSFHFSTGGNGGSGFDFSNAEDIFEEFLRTSGNGSDRPPDSNGHSSAAKTLRTAHPGPNLRAESPEPEPDHEQKLYPTSDAKYREDLVSSGMEEDVRNDRNYVPRQTERTVSQGHSYESSFDSAGGPRSYAPGKRRKASNLAAQRAFRQQRAERLAQADREELDRQLRGDAPITKMAALGAANLAELYGQRHSRGSRGDHTKTRGRHSRTRKAGDAVHYTISRDNTWCSSQGADPNP